MTEHVDTLAWITLVVASVEVSTDPRFSNHQHVAACQSDRGLLLPQEWCVNPRGGFMLALMLSVRSVLLMEEDWIEDEPVVSRATLLGDPHPKTDAQRARLNEKYGGIFDKQSYGQSDDLQMSAAGSSRGAW